MHFYFAEFAFDCADLLWRNPRRQDIIAVLRQPAENFGEMGGILSRAKDHLRHADAQRAMVIDVGEAEIFEGEMAEFLDGLVGGDFAAAYVVEELFEGFCVHLVCAPRELKLARSNKKKWLRRWPEGRLYPVHRDTSSTRSIEAPALTRSIGTPTPSNRSEAGFDCYATISFRGLPMRSTSPK